MTDINHTPLRYGESTTMKQLIRRAAFSSLTLAVLAGAAITMPAAIAAKGTAVTNSGSCSGASDWKLKVKPDDGRLEVEFEVDQNRNGKTWNVTLKHNGNQFWSGQKVTQAPSGSFEVHKRTGNAAGTDTFSGRALNAATGEVCQGSVSI
jgi:2-methylaconitate cis-trans-isomerase PrpF